MGDKEVRKYLMQHATRKGCLMPLCPLEEFSDPYSPGSPGLLVAGQTTCLGEDSIWNAHSIYCRTEE